MVISFFDIITRMNDLKPTKDSQNAVFSGGVHKYIEDKFVVMTEDEYNKLVLKNPETFYFILE